MAEIDEYIEMFYNRTRPHNHLIGVSQEAFEAVSKRITGCPQKSEKPRCLQKWTPDKKGRHLGCFEGDISVDTLG